MRPSAFLLTLVTAGSFFATSPMVAMADQTGHVSFTTAHDNDVMISIGGGKPIPVTFDSGSIGLVVHEPAIGNDAVKLNDPPTVQTYDKKNQYHVRFVRAKATIAGLTTNPMKIGVIFETSCVASHPCATVTGAALTKGIENRKSYGIMGVGVGAGNLENPLEELPAPYSDGFIVSNTGITLGTAGATAFKKLPLTPIPVKPKYPHNDRYKAYDGQFTACFTIAQTSLNNHCMPTIFDTGAGHITTPASVLAVPPKTPTRARVTAASAFDWSFIGSRNATDYPYGTSAASHANIGLPLLLDYDVEVSFKDGTYGFRKLPAPLPAGSLRKI
jgi:hypothetical protein